MSGMSTPRAASSPTAPAPSASPPSLPSGDPPLRVLVTGASGFLGGYVVGELAAHGHTVIATGRNESALRALGEAATEIVVADLADLPPTGRIQADAVIHCAALSTPWGRRRDFERANVAGTAHALETARLVGARRFVNVSSPSVYAAPRDRFDVREDQLASGRPLNGYIASKLAAERLVAEAVRTGQIPEAITLRPRGLIGVGDPSLVPRLLDVHARIGVPLFGGGEHLIDVTAVQNVATALRLALTRGDARGGVYNITNGEPRPFRVLLDQLLTACGLPLRHRRLPRRAAWVAASALEAVCGVLPGRPEPPLTRYTLTTIGYAQTLDISRARTELGYTPTVSLDEALAAIGAAHRGAPPEAGSPTDNPGSGREVSCPD